MEKLEISRIQGIVCISFSPNELQSMLKFEKGLYKSLSPEIALYEFPSK